MEHTVDNFGTHTRTLYCRIAEKKLPKEWTDNKTSVPKNKFRVAKKRKMKSVTKRIIFSLVYRVTLYGKWGCEGCTIAECSE